MTQAAIDWRPNGHDVVRISHAPLSMSYDRPRVVRPSHRELLAEIHARIERPRPYENTLDTFLRLHPEFLLNAELTALIPLAKQILTQ